MVNEIIEFKISSLDNIIKYLNNRNYNIDNLIIELGIPTYNNEFGTVIIEPINKLFNKIVLSIDKDVLRQITFYGNLSISFQDLINKYGNYREAYSTYDNLFFYFFNEQNLSNVIVCKSEVPIISVLTNKLKQIDIKFA